MSALTLKLKTTGAAAPANNRAVHVPLSRAVEALCRGQLRQLRQARRARSARFMISTLTFRLGNALEISSRFVAMAPRAKGCPIVGRVGAAQTKWNDVIELNVIEGHVAAQAFLLLCLKHPLLQPR